MRESEGKRIVGYVRVSAQDQNVHGQVDASQQAGATRLVVEHSSGVGARPQLEALVFSLTESDTLAITEVSKLVRTTAQVGHRCREWRSQPAASKPAVGTVSKWP